MPTMSNAFASSSNSRNLNHPAPTTPMDRKETAAYLSRLGKRHASTALEEPHVPFLKAVKRLDDLCDADLLTPETQIRARIMNNLPLEESDREEAIRRLSIHILKRYPFQEQNEYDTFPIYANACDHLLIRVSNQSIWNYMCDAQINADEEERMLWNCNKDAQLDDNIRMNIFITLTHLRELDHCFRLSILYVLLKPRECKRFNFNFSTTMVHLLKRLYAGEILNGENVERIHIIHKDLIEEDFTLKDHSYSSDHWMESARDLQQNIIQSQNQFEFSLNITVLHIAEFYYEYRLAKWLQQMLQYIGQRQSDGHMVLHFTCRITILYISPQCQNATQVIQEKKLPHLRLDKVTINKPTAHMHYSLRDGADMWPPDDHAYVYDDAGIPL